MHQQQTAFENIVGKEEIACNKQFILFPQCFLLNQITVSSSVHIFDILFLFPAEMEEPKMGTSGKGLKPNFSCLVEGNLENNVSNGQIPCNNAFTSGCVFELFLIFDSGSNFFTTFRL